MQQIQHPSNIARALILAVSVCYHARLQDREAYEVLMARQFQNPLHLPKGAEDFRDVIRWYNVYACTVTINSPVFFFVVFFCFLGIYYIIVSCVNYFAGCVL